MANYKCGKCGKSMDEGQFYTYKDGTKVELCKKCLTMHLDAYDETTFLWLLEKMDVPYVPAEWQVLVDKAYAKDPLKFSSAAVFGKYLSKMKLKQWKEYGWADGPRLIAEAEGKAAETQAQNEERDAFYREKFENGEISEAEFKTLTSTRSQRENMTAVTANPYLGPNNPYDENKFFSEDEMPDLGAELTRDDKLYLANKWGRMYQPAEWVALEADYAQMVNAFEVKDPDTMNTLILICKTNLKMNQSLDNGDVEGFQKLSKVSESLRKSAKFTAAQNKKEKDENFVDSIGQLVVMCEQQGFIPRFATDIPQDKVDLTLQDMNNYLNKLVTQDLGFGQQIEDAIKKIQLQKEMNDAADQDIDFELQDEDFQAFMEEQESQRAADEDLLLGETEEEE